MIVCVCKGISDRKILNVIQEGAHTVDQVTARCKAGGDCGSCRRVIGEMLLGQRADQTSCLRSTDRPDRAAA